jgi:hypothetical protein
MAMITTTLQSVWFVLICFIFHIFSISSIYSWVNVWCMNSSNVRCIYIQNQINCCLFIDFDILYFANTSQCHTNTTQTQTHTHTHALNKLLVFACFIRLCLQLYVQIHTNTYKYIYSSYIYSCVWLLTFVYKCVQSCHVNYPKPAQPKDTWMQW